MADDSSAPLLPSTTSITQVLQALLISLAWAFDAQQAFISVFTDAAPTWHCTNPTCTTSSNSPCSLPTGSWDWDHPGHTSIISDWSLQCSSPVIIGLPASAFFAGCLVGGLFLATLADSLLGRKNMLFLSSLTMSLAGVLTVFSPNIWVYAVFRFISGVGRATIGTSALVLSTEMVGSKISITGFLFFTIGFVSLPGMAYVGQGYSWRTLYLWTSVPCLCYSVAGFFLVSESPRWLSVAGRQELDVFSAMKILIEKNWAWRRLAATMTVAFGIGIVYYGMPLNAGNLGSNLYLNVMFNALAELPSALATFFLVGAIDRRSTTLVLTAVSGVCSIVCVVVKPEGLRMVAELASFFSACTACNVLLMYTIELFPTCVRNSALSMVRQALVCGAVFAPVLIAAGREWSFLSFGVFGLVIGFCGLFVGLLPETRGTKLSDTIEEEEFKQLLEKK